MTSLEFLFQNLLECPKDKFIWYSYFDKAKKMHKQETIKFANDFWNWAKGSNFDISDAEQYYQETFVSKGSDEHIVDTNEMISEDKMLTEATNRYVIEDEIEAFIQGANWMQEKLKI